MLNYVRAELYRIAHKRSAYYYYGGLVALFLVMIVFFGNFESPSSFVEFGSLLISVVSIFVFVQAFMAVYTDDLNSKTLGNTISTGRSRFSIITSKIMIAMIYAGIIFAALVGIFAIIYFILGGRFNSTDITLWNHLFVNGFSAFATAIAYMSIISILVYGLQSSPVSITSYVLLFTGVINSILSLLAGTVPYVDTIYKYTITSLYTSYNAATLDAAVYWGGTIAYIVGGIAIATFIFSKKEIDN